MPNTWQAYVGDACIYTCHIWNHWPQTFSRDHCTYLTYSTEQIWLPHLNYRSHGQHALLTYRPNSFALIYQNTTNASSTSHVTAKCVTYKYCHQIGYLCNISQYLICISGGSMCIYGTYETCAFKVVQRHTHTHTHMTEHDCYRLSLASKSAK